MAEDLEVVRELAEASGVLQPVQEVMGAMADRVQFPRERHRLEMIKRAAEKARELGLPPAAIPDKFVRAALEDGPWEDDESMQERWINLLTNGLTDSSAQVRIAYTAILRELEAQEASLLDQWVDAPTPRNGIVAVDPTDPQRDIRADMDNLERLGLVYLERQLRLKDGRAWEYGTVEQIVVTQLGREFVEACREPVKDDD